MGKPNFIDAAAAWQSMRAQLPPEKFPFTVPILDEYFFASKSPIEPPAKSANSSVRPCSSGGIQPHGGDEYRCYWCNMVWSRDEERPPCPRA